VVTRVVTLVVALEAKVALLSQVVQVGTEIISGGSLDVATATGSGAFEPEALVATNLWRWWQQRRRLAAGAMMTESDFVSEPRSETSYKPAV
jgi:hypothetical protein